MTCADVQRVLPDMMEGGQDGEFQAHLRLCPACAELVSDLELISRQAQELAATEEPPARVWVRIAAELRAEGLIRESDPAPSRPLLVPTPRRWWSAWWLAPVAAGLVVAGSYVVTHKSVQPVTQQPVAQKPAVVAPEQAPTLAGSPASGAAVQAPATQIAKKNSPPSVEVKRSKALEPQEDTEFSPPVMTVGTNSDEQDQQFLNGLSPAMRSSYESQLKAVNSYIRDAEAYLKKHPGDEDARQHLMDAYEQKAMLYQMALDHVQ